MSKFPTRAQAQKSSEDALGNFIARCIYEAIALNQFQVMVKLPDGVSGNYVDTITSALEEVGYEIEYFNQELTGSKDRERHMDIRWHDPDQLKCHTTEWWQQGITK